MYCKNLNKLKLTKYLNNINDNDYKFTDEYKIQRGKYKLNQLDRRGLSYSKKLDYEFTINGIVYYPGGVTKKQ